MDVIKNQNDNFDKFVAMLKADAERDKTYVLNMERLKEFEVIYQKISKVLLETNPDTKIACRLGKLTPTRAVITVEADDIIVEDIKEFVSGIENVTNFEIYPLTTGKIKMGIVVAGIMTRV